MKNFQINSIQAKLISDSKGKKTIQVQLGTDKGVFFSSVPSGTSKGKFEAFEIEANLAIRNIEKFIKPALLGREIREQKVFDNFLIKLDGTKNKKKLGANTILAVSIAFLRAGAKERELSLFRYISQIVGIKPKLPKPAILLIEGGLHGKNKLDFQEFMVIPEGSNFKERFLKGKKIYGKLKNILKKKFGEKGIITGLEGGFTPPISQIEKVLDYIIEAAKNYDFKIGLDCASSHLKKEKYNIAFYKELIKNYPVLFLEDPFGEGDWENFSRLRRTIKKDVIIVGDDLLTTNIQRMRKAEKIKACNGAIIKPNQIGTVTETLEAVKLAKSFGWKVIVSHRSGETMDDFIADLAVGVAADFIKAGAPLQKERMVKYKRLLEIEKEILKS
jgi:enolase